MASAIGSSLLLGVQLIAVSFAYRIIIPLKFAHHHFPSGSEVGEPLFLTPYINAGRLDEARNASRVEPLIDGVKSHAGYLTVDAVTRSHLYFWFFPKTTADNASAPLLLWLQGGPGTSSLLGLFFENGPYQVTKKVLKRRVHAWTDNYHVLYIDQPVGTGFSFTENDGYVSTEEQMAEHLYAALVQFYTLFPEYQNRDFYITGESYAGKYIPAIGRKIHMMNRNPKTVVNLPLKGLLIGNGFSDPENMLELAAPLRILGFIDRRESQRVEAMQNEVKYLLQSGEWEQAGKMRLKMFEFVGNLTNLTSIFDYRRNENYDKSYVEIVTRPDVRRRIHVGNAEFNGSSPTVFAHLGADNMRSVRPWIEKLLENYPIVFFNGQFDLRCAHWMTESFLGKLHWSGAMKFGQAAKRIWQVDGKPAGYYKSAGNLVYIMVRNAGHMVSPDQPKNALNLVDTFIQGKFNHD